VVARPRSHTKAVCQNEKCRYYRKEKGKDIIKRAKNTAGHQRYYCLHCNTYFVETKGTPLYNKKLSEREIKKICLELVEKKGVRAIERTTKHHRDTIGRLLDDLAIHAQQMTDYLVRDLELSAYEVDEFWAFIKKTRKSMSSRARNGLSKVNNGLTPA
jgi:transposase-like protein